MDLALIYVYMLTILIGICLFAVAGILGLAIIQISHANKEKSKKYLENITYGLVGGIIAVILLEMRGNEWMHFNFYITTLPLSLSTIFVFVLIGFGYLYEIDKLFAFLERLEKDQLGGKSYKGKRPSNIMGKKEWFAVRILFLTLVAVILSWLLANKFSLVAADHVDLIVQTAIFLAGFGLITLGAGKSKGENLLAVILPNVKSIILWSMASIVFTFIYLSYPESVWGDMFIKLSVGFLFFTITLVVLLVFYHDNKYLKEIETKN